MSTAPAEATVRDPRLLGSKEDRTYRILGISLTVVGIALVAFLWWKGRSYYLLDVAERIDHPEHRRLRASGFVGHFYGIAGTVLILLNLLYFVRKHARSLRGKGSLRAWMEVHVFAGLIGTALIVFHSAFQVRNQVATAAAWSLGILVATGLLGRYMYALLPRSGTGEEEGIDLLQAHIGSMRRELAQRAGSEDTARELFRLLAARTAPPTGGPVVALVRLPLLPFDRLRDASARRTIHGYLASQGTITQDDLRTMDGMVAHVLREEARKRSGTVYKGLFVWWRALHRAFALVMVAAMLVHVGVALYYGYRWIF